MRGLKISLGVGDFHFFITFREKVRNTYDYEMEIVPKTAAVRIKLKFLKNLEIKLRIPNRIKTR